MINLDKLKSEIAEMSAEEFASELDEWLIMYYYPAYCEESMYDCGKTCKCDECIVEWLNSESEETK